MQICHLTSVHPLDDVRIFQKQCRTLAAAGHDVSLVGPGPDSHRDSGVSVVGVENRLHGRLARMLLYVWRVFTAARRTGAQVFHFHDPELIPAGVVLRALGHTVVYDAHEDLPKVMRARDYLPALLRLPVAAIAAGIERIAAWSCDRIVVATPSIGRHFPPGKTVIVRNYPDLAEFAADPAPDGAYAARPKMVAYVGVIARERGIVEIVRAAGMIAADARIMVAGRFDTDACQAEARALPAWPRIAYLGWRPRDELSALLRQTARAGLIMLHPLPNHLEALPNKLFEYMAAGLPVIACDLPSFREIITAEHCGLLVDPRAPEAIAAAITWVLDHPDEAEQMGARGRAAVLARYNWEAERRVLLAMYDDLAAERAARVARQAGRATGTAR